MLRNRSRLTPIICSLALLSLGGCGGGDSSEADTPAAALSAATPESASACTGAAQELFAAMQGSYAGQINTELSSGTSLPLNASQSYMVTISASDCRVSIDTDNQTQLGFRYGAADASSRLTGLSPEKTILDPSALDLHAVQYNLGVSLGAIGYELERRVQSMSADTAEVADGDLFLSIYDLNDGSAVYGLDLLASSKR